MYNLLIGILLLFPTPVHAEEKEIVVEQKTIPQLIEFYSTKYNVEASVITNVIRCESTFNPNAVGDGGNSRGLVQIHKPSHPTITDEQAFDPKFAISFLAENLSKGKGKMWTCYRKFYS